MPLWLAVVLLLLALGGIALSRRYLRHDRSAQALCIVVCAGRAGLRGLYRPDRPARGGGAEPSARALKAE